MGIDFSKSHRAMDTRQHEGSYSAFLKLLTATAVLVFIILAGMALFLT